MKNEEEINKFVNDPSKTFEEKRDLLSYELDKEILSLRDILWYAFETFNEKWYIYKLYK